MRICGQGPPGRVAWLPLSREGSLIFVGVDDGAVGLRVTQLICDGTEAPPCPFLLGCDLNQSLRPYMHWCMDPNWGQSGPKITASQDWKRPLKSSKSPPSSMKQAGSISYPIPQP